MARNRAFHRRYLIEFKGITTNDFMGRFLDKIFEGLVDQLGRRKQLRVTKYISEDIRGGLGNELTPAGMQVILSYKGGADGTKRKTEGPEKGGGRQEGRPAKSK